jgi:uncharacterized protein YigE (DUF2233 family)
MRITHFIETALFSLFAIVLLHACKNATNDSLFVSYTVNPREQHVQLYWKDAQQNIFGSINNLKIWLAKNKAQLIFAMNAGMYKPDHSPQGLYIENQQTITPLDTANGSGNFYLQPNGVFYITKEQIGGICKTNAFTNDSNILYATQSGPMLVIDGQIHSAFQVGSVNVNIRNGVGILPDGKIVFAMSKKEINFYDFANYFKSLGCKNALYLDGLVSRTYLPAENWLQMDGDFGVMIGVTKMVD